MHEFAWESLKPEVEKPLYVIRNLGFRYPNGRLALEGIDLVIGKGDRVAVVGNNGSGKTTLIKHLNGLYRGGNGEIRFGGNAFTEENIRTARLKIGVLFQDPDDHLFCNTLYEDVAFGPLNQGYDLREVKSIVFHSLVRVGLEDKAYKAPHNLSFGQRKRAALAAVLAMRPEVLILDEPTSNLDPKQEGIIFDILGQFEGTLIVTSHDLPFLYGICQRAIVLDGGRIHHDYTMKELVSHKKSLREHGLDFSFRFSCCSEDGLHDHPHVAVSPKPAEKRVSDQKPAIMEMKGYTYRYGDGSAGLHHMDLVVREGEKTALIGENGAGKSTLAFCLAGIFTGTGTYRFRGKAVNMGKKKGLWPQVGLVFQDSADQLFCPSCEEEVAFAPKQLGLPPERIEKRVKTALKQVRLEGFEQRVPHNLSGGEKKRLAIASVLSMKPEVLILDEPTAGLDPQSEELLIDILAGLHSTIILISHDFHIISRVCERTVLLHKGHIILDTPLRKFLEDERLTSFYTLNHTFKNRCCDEIIDIQKSAKF
jgi:energy-coupling factor transporter ATP-binding protein EcfA2